MSSSTVLVELSINYGAAINDLYWQIGSSAPAGRIGTFKLAGDTVWYDVSDRVMSFTAGRDASTSTAAGPLAEYGGGTMTMQLLNDDGALDPANMAQPAAGAEIRIRKVWNGTPWFVWRGYINTWVPDHRSPTVAVVQVTANDGTRMLNMDRTPVAAVGAGETADARINRILDGVGWPTNRRNVATATTAMPATTLDGNALDELRAVARSDIGLLYVDANGFLTFLPRVLVQSWADGDPTWTFGSNTAGGEIPFVDRLGLAYDADDMANVVTGTAIGGTAQTVTDAASVARYRQHQYDQDGLWLTSDREAQNWAAYILHQASVPEFRVTSMVVDTRVRPDLAWPAVLDAQPGDKVRVMRRHPGVDVAVDLTVRGTSHQFSGGDRWTTTFTFASAARYGFWRLEHPVLGRIGTPLGW